MSKSMSGGASLELRGITKTYGRAAAVRDLDLKIEAGEFVTLLGASGSGKTTSLMMLAGFVEPTSGQVMIGGETVTGLAPAQRNLGVVFQNYALFPHLTVAQNLAFPLQMRRLGKKQIAAKVTQLLETVQLADKGQRYPRELSGGQQQRVALARALIFDPRALLLDEPLGALDKNLREHMQHEIKALHTSLGTTMVLVTHDQEEALTLSDRIAVMHDGAIAQIGSPADLYERPLTRWVAEFVGQSNLLDGTVESVQAGRAVLRLANGAALDGACAPSLRQGARASALVRPERIVLSRRGAAHEGQGATLDATVIDSLYLGHTVKYTVALADGQRLAVQLPNTGAASMPVAGDAVTLHTNAQSAWLMPTAAAQVAQAEQAA
ncbi:ABC transporter ATP-binding protein [Caballeronia sp. LZ034LL]|uniref:ABC transporter ATP-binding protein n=1 Tax=Caballeronia sp. LZ034LL TaxID=3038567 RepID=UPI002860931B|nr:ABC transporter ATP-binding protein [Caballeronia sp. LZ034LL]MDR5836261.1 ABC transporter ATP-binding protein [Caballeronia sp. LZ034LL]